MAAQSVNVVVLKDSHGNYYAIPEDVLAKSRVPDQHRGEVEDLVRAGQFKGPAAGAQRQPVIGGADRAGGVSGIGCFAVQSQVAENIGRYRWSTPPLSG